MNYRSVGIGMGIANENMKLLGEKIMYYFWQIVFIKSVFYYKFVETFEKD
jgi:hypothetical protein